MSDTSRGGWTLYDVVMFCYLVIGTVCMPMVVGEALIEAAWVPSIYESGLPQWLIDLAAGYEIVLMFGIVSFMMLAWIPALILCVLYRRRWRVLVPAVLLLATDVCLFFTHGQTRQTALAVLGSATVVASFAIGVEWLLRRRWGGATG